MQRESMLERVQVDVFNEFLVLRERWKRIRNEFSICTSLQATKLPKLLFLSLLIIVLIPRIYPDIIWLIFSWKKIFHNVLLAECFLEKVLENILKLIGMMVGHIRMNRFNNFMSSQPDVWVLLHFLLRVDNICMIDLFHHWWMQLIFFNSFFEFLVIYTQATYQPTRVAFLDRHHAIKLLADYVINEDLLVWIQCFR